MIGSDTLVYRMLFNLTENAIRYNRPDGAVTISICKDEKFIQIRVADTGLRNSGAVPGKHLSAILPRGQVPEPGTRRCRTGTFSGLGNRGTSRRRGDGGGKLGGRHRGSGDAAWLNPSVITHANLVSAHH